MDKPHNKKKPTKGSKITCSRGHAFIKAPWHTACPKCWPGKYKKK